jgi:hypothetical protein
MEERSIGPRRFVLSFFLWKVDPQVRGHGDTAIGTTVPGIVAFENPRPSHQIVDVNIIEPNAVQVLAADDEKFVTRNGGKVSITGFGRGNDGIFI